jgi:hypothetical protein
MGFSTLRYMCTCGGGPGPGPGAPRHREHMGPWGRLIAARAQAQRVPSRAHEPAPAGPAGPHQLVAASNARAGGQVAAAGQRRRGHPQQLLQARGAGRGARRQQQVVQRHGAHLRAGGAACARGEPAGAGARGAATGSSRGRGLPPRPSACRTAAP